MLHCMPRPKSRSHRVVRRAHRASAELSERVRAHVDAKGLVRACADLDTTRETAMRLIARLSVHRGSLASVESALARLDADARARGEDGAA
jgi:hypothetical protein